ncbi:MAG: hypothetical protein N2487_02805 [Verrucomicrobiae bacterium]|nr:hypothetical protein [Verrucomicrobiae bacterium]
MNNEKETWYFYECGECDPRWNMAIDTVLLENAQTIARPLIRLYGWKTPAATFGFFQKQEEIEKITPIRPLVRRPTGGGLVPHINDFTYTIVIPKTHNWYQLKATESYKRVHTWLMKTLELLSVPTELAPQTVRPIRGQCFVGHEQYDILQNGQKIAGAAQRRTKTGLLIQGSVQPRPAGISNHQWANAIQTAATQLFNIKFEKFEPEHHDFLKKHPETM